jgi:DNA (cytosine-5)-methyltransferase 1
MTELKSTQKSSGNHAGRGKTPDLKLIDHREAYNILFSVESAQQHPDAVLAELPAIITHWLQSPKSNPLVLGRQAGVRWRKILSAYSETGNPAEAISRRLKKKFKSNFAIDFGNLPKEFRPIQNPQFSFIDLFAGIGGFRIALQGLGGKCLFSSEWEIHAKETYYANHGEIPFGDIKNFTDNGTTPPVFPDSIPHHDILAGGFPCQAFSQAGRQQGFNDARGTLFFEILKIARTRRPQAIILENVKRLKTHDGGLTFKVIVNSLHELGYKVYAKVLRAYDFGLPQNRERIFIVAFDRPIHFEFPTPPAIRRYLNLGDALERRVDDWYTISDRMFDGHKRRLIKHRERGNGFGFSLFSGDAPYANTISARYWKDGSEVLIKQENKNPRMLTPRECARLQGFPDYFEYHKSRRHAYQQFGNSVPIDVVKAVAEAVIHWNNLGERALALTDPYEPVIF